MALEFSLPFYIVIVFSCTNHAFQSVPKAKLQRNSKRINSGQEIYSYIETIVTLFSYINKVYRDTSSLLSCCTTKRQGYNNVKSVIMKSNNYESEN
jgi:hypothetical protein